MAQNREPPAYQEYAATLLAQIPFRSMSLQDRGLLYTMRLECWVNQRLPSDPIKLAKVLGLPITEVCDSLPAMIPFFSIVGDFIICPELDDYRKHLAERKQKQSQGGKVGSSITNGKRYKKLETTSNIDSTNSSSNSQVPHRGNVEYSAQPSSVKPNQNQFSKKELLDDPFVRDYEAAEQKFAADEYIKATRGD